MGICSILDDKSVCHTHLQHLVDNEHDKEDTTFIYQHNRFDNFHLSSKFSQLFTSRMNSIYLMTHTIGGTVERHHRIYEFYTCLTKELSESLN